MIFRVLLLIFFSISLQAAPALLKLTDLQTGTVAFPPLFDQIRTRLMKEHDHYSFKQGSLIYLKQKSEIELCLGFASSEELEEIYPYLERYFVSPPNSKVPSAMKIDRVHSCE